MLYSALRFPLVRAEPGEVYAYSNQAFGLLGLILENISGQSFEELLERIITAPLCMNSTVQHLPSAFNTRFVSACNSWGIQAHHWDFKALAATGAVRSTVSDLLLYLKANMKNTREPLSDPFTITHKITFSKSAKIDWAGIYLH